MRKTRKVRGWTKELTQLFATVVLDERWRSGGELYELSPVRRSRLAWLPGWPPFVVVLRLVFQEIPTPKDTLEQRLDLATERP